MRTVGIDIGATKVAFGLFQDEQLLERHVEPISDFELTAKHIVEWSKSRGAEALGVGCTGPLDESRGLVKNDFTLGGWFDAPLVPRLAEALKIPVSIINDADAALLGELWSGALKETRNESALMLTFGTGVGGAFWDGNRLLKGCGGEHPEIGHVLVQSEGRPCYCGIRGCLEAETSGMALNELARGLGFQDFADLTKNGDPIPILSQTRAKIDIATRIFAHAYRPCTILLGGGIIARYGEALVPRTALLPPEAPLLLSPMRVMVAHLGADAGVYGAAALASGTLYELD